MTSAQWKTLKKQLEGGGEQAIHEVRKLSRKVEAELKLGQAPRKVRRAWKELRRTVAPIRDHDAVGHHLWEALGRLRVPKAERQAFAADWKRKRQEMVAELELSRFPDWPERPKEIQEKGAGRPGQTGSSFTKGGGGDLAIA